MDFRGNLTFDGVFANTDRQGYLVMKISERTRDPHP